MKQVVSISAMGTISGLQVKPGNGLDLTTLGHASVVRASEILFDEETQRWVVEFRKGAGNYNGYHLTRRIAHAALGDDYAALLPAHGLKPLEAGQARLIFITYNDAVTAEIAVLDGLRLRGLL